MQQAPVEQHPVHTEGPELPSFVNESSRYVKPEREERPSLYGERATFNPNQQPRYTQYRPEQQAAPQQQPAPQQRPARDDFYSEDPFEEDGADTQQQPQERPRRGFTPDIPGFLRNRRK